MKHLRLLHLTSIRATLVGLMLLVQPAFTPASVVARVDTGSFAINSLADVSMKNAELTLREALEVANGTLTSQLSNGEKTQLGGCTFAGNDGGAPDNLAAGDWAITGGCGAGIADTLSFADSFPTNGNIVLLTPLPPMADSLGDYITGVAKFPIIEAAGLAVGVPALHIQTHHHLVQGIVLRGSRGHGVFVQGNDNRLVSVVTIGHTHDGVFITGHNNVVADSAIGVRLSIGDADCATDGNGRDGVAIGGTGSFNQIRYNIVGCNVRHGISVYRSTGSPASDSARENVVGPYNYLGTNATLDQNLPNGIGIALLGEAEANTVISNTVRGNSTTGILLRGARVTSNTVHANRISFSGADGVLIDGGAGRNLVGPAGGSPFGHPTSNRIFANAGNGVQISGAQTDGNEVRGNNIGFDNDAGPAGANGQNGVLLTGATLNNSVSGNYIGGNTRDGVLIVGAASFNTIYNAVGLARPASPGGATQPLPNQLSGVALFDGAHDNTIDGEIAGNLAHGVYMGGSSTQNSVIRGHIHNNGGNGVTLDGAARIRVEARIEQNGASGVWAVNGAASNNIRPSSVFSNAHYGVLLEGASTRKNVVDGSALAAPIAGHGFDGIATRGGAITNTWTHLHIGANGGLPVDVNVVTDGGNDQTATRPTPLGTAYVGYVPPPPEMRSAYVCCNDHVHIITGTAPAGQWIEVYKHRATPPEFGEFVGAGPTDANGIFTATIAFNSSRLSGCFAAFATSYDGEAYVASNEFGVDSCIETQYRIQLPLVVR